MKQVDTLVARPEFSHVLLMRDGHLGYQSMPIGGVTVSDEWVAPGGAGFDIGCGNWTGRTELFMDDIRDELFDIGMEIKGKIAIGLGQAYGTFADDPMTDDLAMTLHHINGLTPEVIKNQFGSVGAGNHYIDLMEDEEGRVWIALHYGSRALGHSIAKHYLTMLDAQDGMHSEPVFLNVHSDEGNRYLLDMIDAGQYATASRIKVGWKIARDVLYTTIDKTVQNHHNYIWNETHYGEDVWVTRKGATPTPPGVEAFIGGSMGTDSVVVESEDCQENDRLFHSAPHGAGRILGRMQAKGKRNRKGVVTREPKVTQDMMDNWVNDFGVVRIGGDVDESPHCYRNLVEDVLPYYEHLKVKHLLTPRLAIMAPPRRRR
jgi:tRNA-splicing ligase RtcB